MEMNNKLTLFLFDCNDLLHSFFALIMTAFSTQLADGLTLKKVSCPLGVLLVVFESRPDALVQVNINTFCVTYCLESC